MKLIITTALILLYAFIAKGLSFIVRIVLARYLNDEAMNLYTLMMPTILFLISISQLGLPNALTNHCAKSKDPYSLFKYAFTISIKINIVIIIIYILCIPLLANYLLKDNCLQPLYYTIILFIPCVSISAIMKGYLQGINKHYEVNLANVMEELIRLLYLLLCYYILHHVTSLHSVMIALFSLIIAEIASIITMFFYLPKINYSTNISLDIKKSLFTQAFWMSLPRLIGTITCFIEPFIILNNSNSSILIETYTTVNSFILPLLVLPSFISITLANYLLPSFAQHYACNQIKKAKQKLGFILSITIFLTIISSITIYIFAEDLLAFLYHSKRGLNLLRQLAFPFTFYSLQPILSAVLHALNKSKQAMLDTLYGNIIRILILIILLPIIKEEAIVLSLLCSIITTTLLHGIRLFMFH